MPIRNNTKNQFDQINYLQRVGIDSDLGLGVVPTDFNLKILSKFVNESGVMDRSIFGTIVRYSTDVLNLIANDMGTQVNLSQIIEVVEMEVALIKLYNDNGHFLPVNDSVGLYEIKLSDFMEMFTSVSYFQLKPAFVQKKTRLFGVFFSKPKFSVCLFFCIKSGTLFLAKLFELIFYRKCSDAISTPPIY
jgi:hypothetical protein